MMSRKQPFHLAYTCILLLLLLLPVLPGYAATDTLNARFFALIWSNDAQFFVNAESKEYYYFSGGEYLPLDYQMAQVGKLNEYRGATEFILFKKILNADQEAQFVPIGQCSLSDQKAFTLIIVPKNPDGAVYMIPVPIQTRPDGRSEIVLLNATNFLMAARINDDLRRLEPMAVDVFSLGDLTNPNTPVRIAVFDQAWTLAYNIISRFAPDRSYLAIFYREVQSESYRLRIFRDLVLPGVEALEE
jgi:hypothetical protein